MDDVDKVDEQQAAIIVGDGNDGEQRQQAENAVSQIKVQVEVHQEDNPYDEADNKNISGDPVEHLGT